MRRPNYVRKLERQPCNREGKDWPLSLKKRERLVCNREGKDWIFPKIDYVDGRFLQSPDHHNKEIEHL